MKKQVHFAIIGCGGIAGAHLGALEKLPKHFKVIAVCDANRPAAEKFAQRLGLSDSQVCTTVKEIAENRQVEAVLVATPHNQHYPMVRELLEAGKHVLVEKPFALNQEEAIKLVALADKNKVRLAVGHCQRHSPAGLAIRDIIAQGYLGNVFGAHATALQYLPRYVTLESNHWLYSSKLAGGGIVISVAVHKLDLLRFLLGEVETASALFEIDPSRGTPERAFEWTAGVNLKFASGAIATLFACYKAYSPNWENETLHLLGSEGTIRASGWDEFEIVSKKLPAWADTFIRYQPKATSEWVKQLEVFHASIVEGTPNPADAHDAVKTMALIDAIYESAAQNGTPIRPKQ